MLLRFRTPKYVAIADVEKAFLQVRLHEKDRDATRFLWVRNINQPISEGKIITFRFTRVTFGLNVSPYLLGGTIHHHLRTTVDDTTLADEIRNNLYVDNLILAASTEEELVQKSLTTRQIFQDMGMNLREFLPNKDALRDKVPEEAHTMKTTQKVLGITWDAKRDCINIRCTFAPLENITKRVIARQIAMIYDPFDASEIAIAASAYIFDENYSELAMAKCKLPSIKTKTTMPKYVNTSHNPADAGTRGLSRVQMHDRYWWEGPEFLKKPIKEWQHPVYQLCEDVVGDDSCALTNVNFTCGQDETPYALMDLYRYSLLARFRWQNE
ncbi:hypothetical protein V3C99_017068 [Haemonchus contortus]|uniref:Reverse transcriptase domain-containing protein n=1 Tax=Haemonchus contortus TaxID=6289 RepID=A0A7I4YYE6_HAECO